MLLDHRPDVRLVEQPPATQQDRSPPVAAIGDDVLLAQVAAGDRPALSMLYDRFCGLVYGVALRVVRDPSMAEEVAQEVFLWVWSNAESFDRSRGTARGWLTTIAHRRAVDVVRSEQASRDRLLRVEQRAFHRSYDEVAETAVAHSEQREVRVALDALTPIQRGAVELAYYHGMTYRQVAGVLDIPLGTVKTRIRDGLRRLAAELAHVGPDEAHLSA